RGQLSFPIHNYLLRSVQNRCLNYIRTLHTRERVLDEYREELIAFQEEFCKNDNNTLQLLEIEELKSQVNTVIDSLSVKCRLVFEKYLYEGMSPQEIADEQAISVNTVRVHIKNAMDHIKLQLGPTADTVFVSLREALVSSLFPCLFYALLYSSLGISSPACLCRRMGRYRRI
ncbi:MAG: sigma-70 family RNA polymerase sigma factor, partial [Bacteroides sp.]